MDQNGVIQSIIACAPRREATRIPEMLRLHQIQVQRPRQRRQHQPRGLPMALVHWLTRSLDLLLLVKLRRSLRPRRLRHSRICARGDMRLCCIRHPRGILARDPLLLVILVSRLLLLHHLHLHSANLLGFNTVYTNQKFTLMVLYAGDAWCVCCRGTNYGG